MEHLLIKFCMKHIVNHMVFQFNRLHLTLGGIERSNQDHWVLIVSPVRSTYGGYYGLVVVTPVWRLFAASASAFHRLRDNFKKPYRIASIFDMQIDIGERIAGKQDWPGLIIYGPPRAPRIAKNTHFCIQWLIYEKLCYFFPLLYICLLCDEVLLPWNFRSPGFDVRAPQDPPNMKKKVYFVHILGLNFSYLKDFLSDSFLIWHVHRYGWEDSWKAR